MIALWQHLLVMSLENDLPEKSSWSSTPASLPLVFSWISFSLWHHGSLHCLHERRELHYWKKILMKFLTKKKRKWKTREWMHKEVNYTGRQRWSRRMSKKKERSFFPRENREKVQHFSATVNLSDMCWIITFGISLKTNISSLKCYQRCVEKKGRQVYILSVKTSTLEKGREKTRLFAETTSGLLCLRWTTISTLGFSWVHKQALSFRVITVICSSVQHLVSCIWEYFLYFLSPQFVLSAQFHSWFPVLVSDKPMTMIWWRLNRHSRETCCRAVNISVSMTCQAWKSPLKICRASFISLTTSSLVRLTSSKVEEHILFLVSSSLCTHTLKLFRISFL